MLHLSESSQTSCFFFFPQLCLAAKTRESTAFCPKCSHIQFFFNKRHAPAFRQFCFVLFLHFAETISNTIYVTFSSQFSYYTYYMWLSDLIDSWVNTNAQTHVNNESTYDKWKFMYKLPLAIRGNNHNSRIINSKKKR